MPLQAFLPVVDDLTGVVLGLAPIQPLDFEGTETTVMVGGKAFPAGITTFFSQSVSYVSIRLSGGSRVSPNYPEVPGLIPISDLYTPSAWLLTKAWSNEGEHLQPQAVLLRALRSGLIVVGGNVTTSPAPEPAAPSTWLVEVPLKDAPACSFWDMPFSTGSLYASGLPAREFIVGAPTPALVIDAQVRIFLFNDAGQVTVPGASTNSLRFIKMVSAALPSTLFIYNAIATFQEGGTQDITLEVRFV
jgi:hypothetical protein